VGICLTCSFRVPKTENCQTLVVTMYIACHIKLLEKLTLFYLLLSQAFIHRVERLRIEGICFPFKDEYKDEPKFGTIYTFLFTYENFGYGYPYYIWCTLCCFCAPNFTSPGLSSPSPIMMYIIHNLVRMSYQYQCAKIISYALMLQIFCHSC